MESRKNLLPSLCLFLAVHDLYNGEEDALSIMETITRLYPACDTNEVLARIEADRKTGGFPPIKELFLLDIRKEELLWEIGVAAGRLDTEKFGRFLTVLGKTDVPCNMALARFLSLYEEKDEGRSGGAFPGFKICSSAGGNVSSARTFIDGRKNESLRESSFSFLCHASL